MPSQRLLRLLAVLVLIGATLWSGPTAAEAHAALRESTPADRERLVTAPERVELLFNEPIDAPTGGLRVFNADAERVDLGLVDTGEDSAVAARLPDDLADGGYVVTYRVLSADSHPINGALVFTVGTGQEVNDAIVSAVFGGDGGWLGMAGNIVRGVLYLASLLAAGAVIFATAVARRDPEVRASRRAALAGAWGAVGLSLLAVPLQASAASGRGVVAMLGSPAMLGETLTSTFGWATIVRVIALLSLIAAWRRPAPGRLAVVGAVATLGSYLLDGHQRTVEPLWLLVSADAVHLFSAAFWLAGVWLLGVALRGPTQPRDPEDAARLVARFSGMALWIVLALALAGSAMGWALVRVPRALVTTGYGWLLTAKVALTAVALAAAAYNRYRLVPAIQVRQQAAGGADLVAEAARVQSHQRAGAAWRQLRVTVGVEVIALVAVSLLTGFLVVQQPAAQAAGVTGAYVVTEPITDELDIQLIVDPNRVGRNAVHIYVLDETGRPAQDVDDVRLELTLVEQDIGPFVVEPFSAGPGHWTAYVDQLLYPGTWHFRVTAGIGTFDEASVTVPVNLNP